MRALIGTLEKAQPSPHDAAATQGVAPRSTSQGDLTYQAGRALADPPEEAADELQGRLRARRVPEAVPPARVTCVVLVVYSTLEADEQPLV